MSEDWREEAKRFEIERARAKRELRRQERAMMMEDQGAQQGAAVRALELRVAGLELAYRELQDAFLASTRAASDVFEQMADHNTGLSNEQRGELRELKIEIAKLNATCSDLRERQVETSASPYFLWCA